jgi:hypothetical protein
MSIADLVTGISNTAKKKPTLQIPARRRATEAQPPYTGQVKSVEGYALPVHAGLASGKILWASG